LTNKTKYVPINYRSEDAVINSQAALVQSAMALDLATEIAARTEDTSTLINASALWLQMSDALNAGEQEVHPKDEEGNRQIGFGNGSN